MYVPNRETTSRLRKVEAVKFHKDAVESRKDYFHGEFTNRSVG